ncbi:MAG: GSCFA domain-containing protein [Phycisphaeraceae bacterium]|nr:GSCFA domain-containing protein [Phycisphaeraceae bacterium]MCB9848108.1 GSCFA domain-containing protein [Phycisphaeraceae bacterium]
MPTHPEITILNLDKQALYPEGRALRPEFLMGHQRTLLTRDTPVASIGSCFAREIKDYLVAHGYNYLQTAQGPNARHGSAAWDRVYNTFCLKQEFQRALSDEFQPQERFWRHEGRLLDPYRKQVVWDDEAHAQRELEAHRIAARQALTSAKVVIITVGLTEIWHSTIDGSVFFQVPPATVFDHDRHAFRNSTAGENLANLEAVRALLHRANPDCQIVITVSPVPLRATFRPCNVVVANTVSKATLVAAVSEFVANHDNVHYFPSYELVTTCIPRAFKSDNRHVTPRAIARIMRVFESMFLDQPGRGAPRSTTPEPAAKPLAHAAN